MFPPPVLRGIVLAVLEIASQLPGAAVSDLSPAEVAAQTGLSRSVIYRLIEDGELRAYKTRGRLRVEAEDLAAFRERNRVEPRKVRAYEPRMGPRKDRGGDTFAGDLRAIRGGKAA